MMPHDHSALRLVRPRLDLQDAFARMVDDYCVGDPGHGQRYFDQVERFPAFLQELEDQGDPEKIAADKVPQSFFWMITPEGEIGGIGRLRHHLNAALEQRGGHIGYEVPPRFRGQGYATTLLALMLPQAREIGIHQVLLTCDVGHLASARVMEKCGGREIERGYLPPDIENRRFVIDL